MTERILCRKCSRLILPATAQRCGGFCAACAKTRGWKPWAQRLGVIVSFPFFYLGLPFVFLWMGICWGWKRLRFPFDQKRLRAMISAVHPDPLVAKSYASGVIHGYWVSREETIGFSQNPAYLHGCNDGGKLRRGEIDFESIPTERRKIVVPDLRRPNANGKRPS